MSSRDVVQTEGESPVILIVEGADLVGKSTLVDALSARHGWPVVKLRWALVGDPEVETRAMAAATVALLDAVRPDVIFDRAFFSWWAYGPALGHEVSFMPDLISRYRPVDETRCVVLTASEAELRARYARSPDAWFSLEVVLAANERFSGLRDLLPAALPCLELDTSTLGVSDVLSSVEAFLSR